MAEKKIPITLDIPAEYGLTNAERDALKKSIRVQIASILSAKKPGTGEDNPFINVPPNKRPRHRRKKRVGTKKPSSKDKSQ